MVVTRSVLTQVAPTTVSVKVVMSLEGETNVHARVNYSANSIYLVLKLLTTCRY